MMIMMEFARSTATPGFMVRRQGRVKHDPCVQFSPISARYWERKFDDRSRAAELFLLFNVNHSANGMKLVESHVLIDS
jgi:hypothetical protein